ncbi:MAG: hypothetical protein IKP45_00015 [Bacteroidales bacterium]|nr:hypothetical protein [Bacteroidales bacterium]
MYELGLNIFLHEEFEWLKPFMAFDGLTLSAQSAKKIAAQCIAPLQIINY